VSNIDLSKMSADDLKSLVSSAERALRERHQQRVVELRREAEDLAKIMNMSVAEVFGIEKGGKPAGKKLAPKYMNPANPSQTWSGRGKRPTWLAEALARGEKLESFAIG
jgi:DNA-binding protein H-NS